MAEIEDILISDLDEIITRLAARVTGDAVQRNLRRTGQVRSPTPTPTSAHLQKLEGETPVFASLEPEAPWLTGALPGETDVDEALGSLPEQLRPRVDNVVNWDLHVSCLDTHLEHSTALQHHTTL